MKGETVTINGDPWMIVDVAPAAPLAEMVAAVLEEEGLVVMTRGPDSLSDIFSHMGVVSIGATFVLVPEAQGEAAMKIISDTVTDFEGEELERLMAEMDVDSSEAED